MFTLHPTSGVPIYRQLVEQVRRLIAGGQLPPGAELPSVRDMAQQSTDQNQLTSRIDRLEAVGDQAKRACENAGSSVDPQLQSAVMQAHDQIASLKKQMH